MATTLHQAAERTGLLIVKEMLAFENSRGMTALRESSADLKNYRLNTDARQFFGGSCSEDQFNLYADEVERLMSEWEQRDEPAEIQRAIASL